MKKKHFLLPLLMAIVMMAMSPMKVWADETDARLAQLTLSDGVTATITDNDSHPWVVVTPGETLNGYVLPDKITNGLRSNIVNVHSTTSTSTITLTATKEFKLSFKVYCSSEQSCDYCQVFVDNVEKCDLSKQDGADYTFTANLSAGEHTIKLYYKKDSSANRGIDSGVIYDFQATIPCETHTWGEWKETLAPTCTEKGSKEHTCSVCKLTATEDIPALGHTMQEVAGKAAGRCDDPGHAAYYHCTRCEKNFADQVGTLPTTVSLLITSHVSLDENGLCTVCHVGNPATLSEDGYYLLSTAADLAWFRDFVNTYVIVDEQITHPYAASNARLMADIDMSSICHAADAGNSVEKLSWIPIGNKAAYHYLGTFDGNNHEVTNLYIDTNESQVGLIGYLGTPDLETGATVKNLTVRGSVKSSDQYIGGIVGSTYGTISGCINYATVEGTNSYSSYIGGIAGYSDNSIGTSKVENCTNYGEIKCNSAANSANIAGIVGTTQNTVVTNCCNYAKVETSGYYVGGIVGYTSENSTIKKSINSGNIISNYPYGNYVGGIIGNIYQTTNIEECKNTENVTGVGEYIGGIVGYVESNVSIKNCGNEGTVTSSVGYYWNNEKFSSTGGIVGNARVPSYLFEMSGCYNTGTISAAGNYVGGLVGNIYSTIDGSYVKNCYTTGNVISTTTATYAYIGGAFGCTSFPVINNVYSAATITKNAAATIHVGAFVGYNNSFLTNCYYDSDKTKLDFCGGSNNTIDQSVNGAKSTAAFASGEVAYLLNGSRSAGTAESPLVWYQAIGADAYPTLDQNEYTIVKYDATNGYYNDIENFASITLQDGAVYDAKLKRTTDQLTYTRTFTGTNWTTWYVPFDLTLTDDICAKYAFSRINNVHQYDDDEDGVADKTVIESFRQKSGVTLKANYPYLVKALTDGDKTMELTLTDVTVARADENSIDCQSVDYSYTFTGTYAALGESGSTKYSLFDDTETWMHFHSLKPQRHYMTITSRSGSTSNPAPGRLVLDVIGDEDAMGIVTVYADREAGDCREGKMLIDGRIVVVKNGKWYNTEGQQIR